MTERDLWLVGLFSCATSAQVLSISAFIHMHPEVCYYFSYHDIQWVIITYNAHRMLLSAQVSFSSGEGRYIYFTMYILLHKKWPMIAPFLHLWADLEHLSRWKRMYDPITPYEWSLIFIFPTRAIHKFLRETLILLECLTFQELLFFKTTDVT